MDLLKDFNGEKNNSGKVLLYKLHCGIGDLLWRTPLIREIKKKNPKIKLIISGQGPNWKLILKDNPDIDELRDLKNQEGELDDVDVYIEDKLCPHVVSDYSRTLHAIDALSVWAGIDILDKSYVYKTTKEEDDWAIEFLNKYRPGKIIGLGLKASTWIRTWIPTENKRLVKALLHNGYKVILFDISPVDIYDDNIISMAGGYNIREVAAVIKQLDLLITPDTGYLHFAGHFKIPTISIWGGTDPELRIKYYSTVKAVVGKDELHCWPCFLHKPSCPYGIPSPCIAQIKCEDVIETINNSDFL